jgi:hypothetical protein
MTMLSPASYKPPANKGPNVQLLDSDTPQVKPSLASVIFMIAVASLSGLHSTLTNVHPMHQSNQDRNPLEDLNKESPHCQRVYSAVCETFQDPRTDTIA